jgi:hypothetical protein
MTHRSDSLALRKSIIASATHFRRKKPFRVRKNADPRGFRARSAQREA